MSFFSKLRSGCRKLGRVARLILLISALSAPILVAFVWWRSFRHGDIAMLSLVRSSNAMISARQLQLVTGRGTLALTAQSVQFENVKSSANVVRRYYGDEGWTFKRSEQRPEQLPNRWSDPLGGGIPGVKFWHSYDARSSTTRLHVRFVWLAILSILPLIQRAIRWGITRKRARSGRCSACGYDLRGSPYQCPECGLKTKKETGTKKKNRGSPGT